MPTKTNSLTAVILAGGKGSRRLPIARVIDKAMLPLRNRPAIDYVVEQCAAAGVDRIVCVINGHDSLIKEYYQGRIDIAEFYPWLHRTGHIAMDYVLGNQRLYGYGTAAGLATVESVVSDDHFIVTVADGFIYAPDRILYQGLLEAYTATKDAGGALAGLAMPPTEVMKYSLVTEDADHHLVQLYEKLTYPPDQERYLGNVSCYVLSRHIFTYLRNLPVHDDEIFLTDAVVELARHYPVAVVAVDGEYLDSGSVESWVQANSYLQKRLTD